jgi:hypothetical protein
MTDQEKLNRMTSIAAEITDGDLYSVETAECPFCGSRSLRFSFTLGDPPRYGLYLRCDNCGHLQHFSLNGRPKNFRDDLVFKEFQDLEDEATEISRSRLRSRPGGQRYPK